MCYCEWWDNKDPPERGSSRANLRGGRSRTPDLDFAVRAGRDELPLFWIVGGPQDGALVRFKGLAENRPLLTALKSESVELLDMLVV